MVDESLPTRPLSRYRPNIARDGWLFKCEYHIIPDMRHSYKLSSQYQYMKIIIIDIILRLPEIKFFNVHTYNF